MIGPSFCWGVFGLRTYSFLGSFLIYLVVGFSPTVWKIWRCRQIGIMKPQEVCEFVPKKSWWWRSHMTRNPRLGKSWPPKFSGIKCWSLLLFITCSLRIMGSQVTDGLEIQKTPAIQTTAKHLKFAGLVMTSISGVHHRKLNLKIGHHGISLPPPARVQALQGRCPRSLGRLTIPGEGLVRYSTKGSDSVDHDFVPSTWSLDFCFWHLWGDSLLCKEIFWCFFWGEVVFAQKDHWKVWVVSSPCHFEPIATW